MNTTKKPLVSVIVPTKNSREFLGACLASIQNQSYQNIEVIVVDNNSNDNTKKIAKKYTKKIFNKGPERSAQRNFGAKKSKGDYLLMIDSDMELSKKVVEECVDKVAKNKEIKSIVIPEESFGEGFWAECKKLERSFYVGVEWIEASRFFDRNTFDKVDGYNEVLVSGEDWDLSQRFENEGKKSRINSYIYHNEGKLSLLRTLMKKYYYSQKILLYKLESDSDNKFKQFSPVRRYLLLFSNPQKIINKPLVFFGVAYMKSLEYIFGGFGWIKAIFTERKQ